MNFKTWMESELDESERFYQDNEQKVLQNPEIQEQLKTLFQADGRLIRRILGVGSEDRRGNYFINIFNQRYGDEEKSLRVPLSIKFPELQPQPKKPEAPVISKETLSWFKGSKITEKNGSPKIVYHGTTEKFDRFEAGEFGFHFGDENAANMMGDTQKFLLRITKPLRLKDLGVWEPDRVLQELKRKFEIPDEVLSDVLQKTRELGSHPDLDDDDDIDHVANRKAHYAWSEPVRELIKSLGYDGIVYRNEAEGFSDSYIVFDNEQIRRV